MILARLPNLRLGLTRRSVLKNLRLPGPSLNLRFVLLFSVGAKFTSSAFRCSGPGVFLPRPI